jgi:hypothetical protein
MIQHTDLTAAPAFPHGWSAGNAPETLRLRYGNRFPFLIFPF